MTATKHESLSYADYGSLTGIHYSRLKLMAKSPLHYRQGPPSYSTETQREGQLIHTAVLEPERFELEARVWTGGMTADGKRKTLNKNSNAYKEFCEQVRAEGGFVVEEWERDRILTIADRVRNHYYAGALFDSGEAEVSITRKHKSGFTLKGRLDWVGRWLVDLKTTKNARPDKFARDAYTYGYFVQCAFYADLHHALTGERRPFALVCVEKSKPYDVVCFRVPDEAIDLGRQKYEGWLRTLRTCTDEDVWPGQDEHKGIIDLGLPHWAYEELETQTIYVDGKAVM